MMTETSRPDGGGARPRGRGLAAATVAAGIVVALLLGEVLLRFVAPQYLRLHLHPTNLVRDRFIDHDRLGQYDELLGWKLRPDGVDENRGMEFRHELRTNSLGYRDDELRFARRAGTRRVVLLGDSFGMGWGVRREEMLATLLEREMPGTEVVNLSVAGYGTDQEVLLYERDGVKFDADIVLLLFCVPNDVENNHRMSQRYRKPYFLPDGDGLALHGVPVPYTMIESRKVPVTHSAFPVHDWWNSHSALYATVFHRLASIRFFRERWEASGLLHRQVAVFDMPEIDILRKEYDPDLRLAWRITERLLRRFRDDVCARGATPVLVIVPGHTQVYPEIWWDAVRERGLDPEEFDRARPDDLLMTFCRDEGLAALDLLPVLREASHESLPLYYRRDPHWTPEGHRVASQAVAEFLGRSDLAGCPPPEQP